MIQDNNQQIFISLERYQTPKITENKSKGIVYFGNVLFYYAIIL